MSSNAERESNVWNLSTKTIRDCGDGTAHLVFIGLSPFVKPVYFALEYAKISRKKIGGWAIETWGDRGAGNCPAAFLRSKPTVHIVDPLNK